MIAPRFPTRVASSVSRAAAKYACATTGMSSRRSTTRVYLPAGPRATRRLEVPRWDERAVGMRLLRLALVMTRIGRAEALVYRKGSVCGASISFEKVSQKEGFCFRLLFATRTVGLVLKNCRTLFRSWLAK